MFRLTIFAVLISCVGNPVSEKQVATTDNSDVVDGTEQYFYEAYRMVGYGSNRHVAVKLEVLQNVPQKIYLVDLGNSEPWAKVSEMVEVSLDCDETANCQGQADGQEFMLKWAKQANFVVQLVIYQEQDDGARATYGYHRVLTAMGEQLALDAEVIEQRYFAESVADASASEDLADSSGSEDGFDFLVGGQTDTFQVEVDQIFTVSFKMREPDPKIARSPEKVRIEAHDVNGNVVDDVLAGAGTLNYNAGTIFHPTTSTVFIIPLLTTNYSVFLVPEAISRGVTKLVGYAEGVKAGEVAISLLPSSRTLTIENDGSETTYSFTPVPDPNHRRGDYRFLYITLKEVDGNGTITGNFYNTEQGLHSGGTSTYSHNHRPDRSFLIIDNDNLPCVAPNTIYAWLQKYTNGKEVPTEDRKLYRIDCP